MANNDIYLDYAAATPLDKRVLKAMQPYFGDNFHNPSSDYTPARQAKQAVEESRETIARFLGAKPAEIVFTAGGTEANNLAIIGTAEKNPGSHIVATAIEHDSVLKPLEYLKDHGWKVTLIKPGKDGIVDENKLIEQITDDTVLLSVMHANNEVGSIQPVSKLADALKGIKRDRQKRSIKKPLYLHSDACQTTQYLDTHVSRLGIDLLVINSDKIYGPKQCGALFIKAGTAIDPIIFGGNQESGLRSGTPNVPSVVGFAEAIRITDKMKDTETQRMKKLQQYLYDEILKIKGAIVNGSMKRRLPNNLHVTFPGIDGERLLMELDALGIYASSGSACSASSDDPSYVLKALGLSDARAKSSLRFSMGRQTDKKGLDRAIQTIRSLVV